jgi:hypothetical protein
MHGSRKDTLHMKIAPFGGDTDLGVSDGFSLRGDLHAFGGKFAFVDGNISTSGIVPEIRLRGKSENIDLGAVALKDAAVDVKVGLSTDQFFLVKGFMKLLNAKKTVDVEIGKTKMRIDTTDELGGIYRTDYHLSSPAAGKPSWDLRAKFCNDFIQTLEETVSKKALEWAEKTKSDYARAQSGLDKALKDVAKIDKSIAAERVQVKAKRKKQAAGLNQAQAKVNGIQKQIDKIRGEINGKRQKSKAKVTAKYKTFKSKEKSWKAAVKAREKAKGLKKVKAKAKEAKAFASYKSAKAAYDTANVAYKAGTKIPVDANARIVSLNASKATATGALNVAKKLVDTFPIDADPRIASLIVARGTATGALKVAKGAVGLSEKAIQGAGEGHVVGHQEQRQACHDRLGEL